MQVIHLPKSRKATCCIVLALGLMSICALLAQMNPPQPKRVDQADEKSGNASRAEANALARLDQLEKRLEQLTTRVESELRAATIRFDAMVRSSDRAFGVLALLGAFGSFLGGLIVVLSWLRGRKIDERHRQDYEREREFYERRALDVERRQNESQILALAISKGAASRESDFAKQQLQLGDNFLAHSSDILSRQIDSIEKLGGVIELVKKTFEMQLTRVGDVEKLLERLGQTDEVVASFTKHFREQYRHVRELVLTFKRHSRMDWTRLTDHEVALVSRALTIFDTIPNSVLNSVLTEEDGRNRFDVAQIYQLLGVGAFYTNDVDAAARYLERALEIYGNNDAPAENLFPQAFCSHFLGLLEKNWCHLDRPQEANLAAARRHLEDAAKRLRSREGEFLTPVTLAEVLSYSEQTWQDAQSLLQDILTRFERISAARQALDENQQVLLGRSLLLLGNLDYARGNHEPALVWYAKAHEQNERNPYAILSMAQATDVGRVDLRQERFRAGLMALSSSGVLEKRENTARLLAIAWAATAACEISDEVTQRKYMHDLEVAMSYVRPVGGRAPLFFCPITKKLVNFDQLRSNITAHITANAKVQSSGV